MSSVCPSAPQSQGEVESTAPAPISSTPAPNGPLTTADIKETVDRIRANQDYQAVLQLALRSLEKAITKNHDLQKVFQKEMVSKPKSGRGNPRAVLEMSASTFSPSKTSRANESDDEDVEGEEDESSIGNILIKRCPRAEYFHDPYGQWPKVPEEVGARGIIYPEAPERKKRFVGAELSKLRQLVRQQNQQFLYSQLYTRTTTHSDVLTPHHLDQFEAEKRRISNLSDFELEKDPSHIDWDAIQAASFPNRTPNELETEWRLFCDPNYIRGPWSTEEDQKLLEAAQRHHERHWDLIAQDMGNQRLPVQYLSRYQQALRPKNVTDARETTSRSYSVTTGAHKAKLTRGTAGFQLALEGTSKASKKTKRHQSLPDDVPTSEAPATPGAVPSTNTATSPILSKRTTATSPVVANGRAREEHEVDETQEVAGEEMEDAEGDKEEEAVIVIAKSGIKWTPDEDELLTEAVKRYGDKNWTAVASLLGSLRTGQQCLHRWQKTLNPTIRRGRWEQEEDNLLAMAVKAYGAGNWRLIQKHVPGRTDVQCRERWVNILDPSVKSSEGWTAAEDAHLLEIVASQPPGKWSLVAKYHNEGMLAQYQRLVSPAQPSSSNSMDVDTSDSTSNAPTASQAPSQTPQANNSSSQDSVRNTTPNRPGGRRNGRNANPIPVIVKPSTRTDNQCWRRWKVLKKVTPKKAGPVNSGNGTTNTAAFGNFDLEAFAAESMASSTGENPSIAPFDAISTPTPRKAPRPRASTSSTPRRLSSASNAEPTSSTPSTPSNTRPSSTTKKTKDSAKKGSSTTKKRARKVPDWMRDDPENYNDDDDEEAIVARRAKRPKLNSAEETDPTVEPSPAKRSTRRAAKAAVAAMAAASEDIPMTFIDLPPSPPRPPAKERSVASPKPAFAISVVPLPDSSAPTSLASNPTSAAPTEQRTEDGNAPSAKVSLKLRFTKI